MSETNKLSGQPDTNTLESGSNLLDRIAANPPAAEPVLLEERSRREAVGAKPNEPVIHSATEAQNEAGEARVLRVDPKDYAHVQDHKGRPFNPALHKVKPDGSPDFNARGKVKMLAVGEENPIRLILDPLKNLLPKEPERPAIECEAQAAVLIDESKVRVNAECIADLYCGTGYILRGGKFIRGWDKQRRPRIVNSLINYERQTGQLMAIAPWVLLAHTFAADIVTVEGGDRFDSGGGLIGVLKGFFARRKTMKQSVTPVKQGGEHVA